MTEWKTKLQQNSSKPNLAKYKKNHGSWSNEIWSDDQILIKWECKDDSTEKYQSM